MRQVRPPKTSVPPSSSAGAIPASSSSRLRTNAPGRSVPSSNSSDASVLVVRSMMVTVIGAASGRFGVSVAGVPKVT